MSKGQTLQEPFPKRITQRESCGLNLFSQWNKTARANRFL